MCGAGPPGSSPHLRRKNLDSALASENAVRSANSDSDGFDERCRHVSMIARRRSLTTSRKQTPSIARCRWRVRLDIAIALAAASRCGL